MEEEQEMVIVVVPLEREAAAELTRKLGVSGYQPLMFNNVEEMLGEAGYEALEVEKFDPSVYQSRLSSIEQIAKHGGPDKQLRMLGHIAWALTDIAQTHKRAMPPVL